MLGAGAWGTALALLAAGNGSYVNVWARESDVADWISVRHENQRYLCGVTLPASIQAATDPSGIARADAVLVAVPAQSVRETIEAFAPALPSKPVVVCAKGMERRTGLLMTEVIEDVLPGIDTAILSGPSFASDVARGRPTAITIAGKPDTVARLQATLAAPAFRPYGSDDPIGVALGGAAKNVYAIACGIASGLGLGESAVAALLARSFAELVRMGEAMGAKRDTLMGLSGLGDLVLSATSTSSRNFALGRELGRGAALDLLTSTGQPLAEGVGTAPALIARAHALGIELPIAEATAAILKGSLSPGDAIARLMSRPLTSE